MSTSSSRLPKSRVALRPAEAEDAEILLRWRNLPSIVALSSTQRPVTTEEHAFWYADTLNGGKRRLFIVTENAEPIGQVRFDFLSGSEAEISVYLMGVKTGKGLGVIAIKQACAVLFRGEQLQRVVAHVRRENKFSISAFRKCGFTPDPYGVQRSGHSRFVLNRE